MRTYTLSHVGDSQLRHDLASLVARDRATTALLLAHIAEFDARRLYLPAAYPSMHAYCVHESKLSEDAAYKRIRVARAARSYPALFAAISEGKLTLNTVMLLAPHLSSRNARDLLAAAEHKTRSELEELIASRFPRSEAPELVPDLEVAELAARPVDSDSDLVRSPDDSERQLVPGPVAPTAQLAARPVQIGSQLAPGQVAPRSRVTPVAPEQFLLQLTIGRATRDKLQHAQNLLGHRLPSGDLERVLDLALDALIEKLERRKFAATNRPRQAPRAGQPNGGSSRHIPAHVRRAVWERDGAQCTFVSESGRRCSARKLLEYDHVEPVARGGTATVAGIRLCCRAHNQYAAECVFGAEFMRGKREAEMRTTVARRRAATKPWRASTRRQATSASRAATDDVIAPLRILGFSADETRRAAQVCREISEASLEIRLRHALAFLRPRAASKTAAAAGS